MAEVDQFIAWAGSVGVTLKRGSGPLLRSTTAVKGDTCFLTDMPLSTGQAGKRMSQVFKTVAAQKYAESGLLTLLQARARVLTEKWSSHGGKRGLTTQALARLHKYRAAFPGELPDDVEDLLNVYIGWVSDELTTQDHYTGMRDLEAVLLITWLL